MLPAVISPASNAQVPLRPILRGSTGVSVLPRARAVGSVGLSVYNQSQVSLGSLARLAGGCSQGLSLSGAVAWLGLAGARGRACPHQQSSSPGTGPRMSPPRVGSWPPPPLPQGRGHLLLSSAALLLASPPWAEPTALLGPSGLELYVSFKKKKHTPQNPPSLRAVAPSRVLRLWVGRCPVGPLTPQSLCSVAPWPAAGCGRARGARAGTSPRARAAPAGGQAGGSVPAALLQLCPPCQSNNPLSGESDLTDPSLVGFLGCFGLGFVVFFFFPLPLGSLKPANLLLVLG